MGLIGRVFKAKPLNDKPMAGQYSTGDGLVENFPEGLVPRAVGACDRHVEELDVPGRSEAKEDREVDTLEVVSDEAQDIVAWRKVEDTFDDLLPAQLFGDLEIVALFFGRALILQSKPGRNESCRLSRAARSEYPNSRPLSVNKTAFRCGRLPEDAAEHIPGAFFRGLTD